ncbi:hypothetical protein [Fictibacillus phosphorivorans]|uniref:hypothetical protein n=1 Tax=Fictibacillus phosphorivorans TaxID=1221500 RepID=UPI000A9306D4|nr:hypothetical protein [Fictibacillus phosphorivorans]
MKLKVYLADILFFIGNKLIIQSALLMGYKDTAEELKNAQAHWLKSEAFKTKNY